MPYSAGTKKVNRQAFDSLLNVAALLKERPEQAEEVANRFPEEMESVAKLSQAPFFRWQPFGLHEGKLYGGYRGTNTCQAGAAFDHKYNKWCIAGNRAGKTLYGLMEDVGDALGIHCVTKRPTFGHHHNPGRDYVRRRFPVPPVDIWIVSDTEETTVNIIQRTLVEQVLGSDRSGLMWNFIRDHCTYSEGSGFNNSMVQFSNGSTITFKHSSQKRNTFQGRRLHKVHHDEVQPKDIYSECITRLVDYHGFFLGTMTPIYDAREGKGIPWIYQDLYMRKEQNNISFHQWSMLDNPHISEEGKRELMSTWEEDEVEARVHGAFVPMGVQLAFPSKLLRPMKKKCLVPMEGTLFAEEDGRVVFDRHGYGKMPKEVSDRLALPDEYDDIFTKPLQPSAEEDQPTPER